MGDIFYYVGIITTIIFWILGICLIRRISIDGLKYCLLAVGLGFMGIMLTTVGEKMNQDVVHAKIVQTKQQIKTNHQQKQIVFQELQTLSQHDKTYQVKLSQYGKLNQNDVKLAHQLKQQRHEFENVGKIN